MKEVLNWMKMAGTIQPETPQIPSNYKELLKWMLEELRENAEACGDIQYFISLMRNTANIMEEKYGFENNPEPSIEEYIDSMVDMYWFIGNMAWFSKTDKLFELKNLYVTEANYNKFVYDKELAEKSIEEKRNNPKSSIEDKKCYILQMKDSKGETYYVIKNSDHKVRKPLGWKEPKKVF